MPVISIPDGTTYHEALAAARRAILEEALRRRAGNVSIAARDLGIGREALHRHIRLIGIDVERFRARNA